VVDVVSNAETKEDPAEKGGGEAERQFDDRVTQTAWYRKKFGIDGHLVSVEVAHTVA
jgi:hypothetical protein